MNTYAYGFPRLGRNREFKKNVEAFWKGAIDQPTLIAALDALQRDITATYRAHVDRFPSGEVTCYDHMLDTAILVGLYAPADLGAYYELCRGHHALEMTKWFNTNYHYLVPDFAALDNPQFAVSACAREKLVASAREGVPRLIGPFTFLKLAKGLDRREFHAALAALARTYASLLDGVKEAHLDEPAFVLELPPEDIEAIKHTYGQLAQTGCALHVFTYYDDVDWMDELLKLPVQSIGLDFVHGTGNLAHILDKGFPKDKTLIAGLVDGRNIWRTNIAAATGTLKQLAAKAPRIAVSNAGPLYHLPITTAVENFDPALLAHLAFAEERLHELRLIADAYDGKAVEAWWTPLDVGANMAVRERVKKLADAEFTRAPSYPARRAAQEKALPLPVFPTTTIGSFPQSPELRKMRADYRAGRITADAYKTFIRQKIADVITLQEDLGLDVLVHGEFERTDMMEFFAQQLDGMATTSNGWIISYGTRVYRPAIVYGDVARPRPMSVAEISYAQSLTKRPVKGILTGPVTVLAWSFVREDVPIEDVACQLALCLRAELEDYERAGIRIVQVDEPAFRERAPVKRRGWPAYFAWAIKAFRLTCASMKPETQVHSHMCYSEFGEIIEHIAAMDFDAISIEASRSKGDILESFERIKFDRQIGLGVWDIHSPAVPTVDEMRGIVDRALKLIPRENFWINPDCGLKTRGWDESIAALKNLVALAKALR